MAFWFFSGIFLPPFLRNSGLLSVMELEDSSLDSESFPSFYVTSELVISLDPSSNFLLRSKLLEEISPNFSDSSGCRFNSAGLYLNLNASFANFLRFFSRESDSPSTESRRLGLFVVESLLVYEFRFFRMSLLLLRSSRLFDELSET